jgi:hypothetical protein
MGGKSYYERGTEDDEPERGNERDSAPKPNSSVSFR